MLRLKFTCLCQTNFDDIATYIKDPDDTLSTTLTIVTKYSILDVAAVLDPPLITVNNVFGQLIIWLALLHQKLKFSNLVAERPVAI